MVRPIGIQHTDLGDGGLAVLAGEVVADHLDVGQVHSQAHIVDDALQSSLVQSGEALQGLNGGGNVVGDLQGLGHFQGSLAGLHGVDDLLLDGLDLGLGGSAGQLIHPGGANQRTVALGDHLNALCGGVSALVELTGQVLHSEHHAVMDGQGVIDVVGLGLSEHGGDAGLEQVLLDVLHIVAVEHTHAGDRADAQNTVDLAQQCAGLVVQTLLLLYKYSVNHET